MKPDTLKRPLLSVDCVVPAAITCIVLCSANYALDILFDRFGMPTSKTIMNDLVIGILGALAVFYYLSASRENARFASAKARIALIGDLNQRIRHSLTSLSASAMSEDRASRLRALDQAMEGIDDILCDFRAKQGERAD